MSRARMDLCDGRCSVGFDFRAAHANVKADCMERKVALYTVDTLRTLAEQELNVARRRSKTMRSLHLPQRECNLSHAWDDVPIIEVDNQRIIRLDWDARTPEGLVQPEWEVLAEVASRYGLKAGFGKGARRWDFGHVQQPGARARL